MKLRTTVFAIVFSSAAVGLAHEIHVPRDQPTIQAGIDVAEDGDEVIVAPGKYHEAINFSGKSITVRSSEGAGRTTIDGTGLNNSVVRCITSEGPDTVLDGFTITGGTGDPSRREGHTFGGGMRIHGATPTVVRCVFVGNTTSGDDGGGGGIYNEESAPAIIACRFERNNTRAGGGILNRTSSPYVQDCVFIGHETLAGGALVDSHGSSSLIVNSVFEGNTAQRAGAVMTNETSRSTIVNSVFFDNSAGDQGGALLVTDVGHVEVSNSVLWQNSSQITLTGNGAATVAYSVVEGGFEGEGNISDDPDFVDPDDGNFRLLPGSPCIDSSNNGAVPEGVETDLDGKPRFVDDPATPNERGRPDPERPELPIVDRGAYEYQPGCGIDVCQFTVKYKSRIQGLRARARLCDLNREPVGPGWRVCFDLELGGHHVTRKCKNTRKKGAAKVTFADLTCGATYAVGVAEVQNPEGEDCTPPDLPEPLDRIIGCLDP